MSEEDFSVYSRGRILHWAKTALWVTDDFTGGKEASSNVARHGKLETALEKLGWSGATFCPIQWNYRRLHGKLVDEGMSDDEATEFLNAVANKSPCKEGTDTTTNLEAKGNGPQPFRAKIIRKPNGKSKPPSQLEINDIHRFCNVGRLSESVALLRMLREFYSLSVSDKAGSSAECKETNRPPDFKAIGKRIFDAEVRGRVVSSSEGLLGSRNPFREEIATSYQQLALNDFFNDAKLVKGEMKIHHQICISKCPVDLTFAIDNQPFCLWEVGITAKSKCTQLARYANLCFTLAHDWKKIPFGFILGVALSLDHISVYAYVVTGVDDMRSYLLYTAPLTSDSCAHVVEFLWHQLEKADRTRRFPVDTEATNTVRDGDFVYKLYDYRGRHLDIDSKRKTALNLKYISGASLMVDMDDVKLLQYPWIEGTHLPDSVAHACALLQELRRLHSDGVVHGDVRLSNVVFRANDSVSFIDFDFSGKAGEAKYPARWLHDGLGDGVRHPEAKEFCRLQFVHDVYSAGHMLSLFHPVDESKRDEWKRAMGMLCSKEQKNPERMLSDVIAMLGDIAKSRLAIVGGSVPEFVRTGSPPRSPVRFGEDNVFSS